MNTCNCFFVFLQTLYELKFIMCRVASNSIQLLFILCKVSDENLCFLLDLIDFLQDCDHTKRNFLILRIYLSSLCLFSGDWFGLCGHFVASLSSMSVHGHAAAGELGVSGGSAMSQGVSAYRECFPGSFTEASHGEKFCGSDLP